METWSEKYFLGNVLIDGDHKKLFEIIDRSYKILFDKFSLDKYDKVVDVIEELRDYTTYHFEREEELMLSVKYNKFFSHKIQHREFIKKIESLNLKEIDENQEESIKELLDFVLDWIKIHVLNVDVKFVEFYNSNNVEN